MHPRMARSNGQSRRLLVELSDVPDFLAAFRERSLSGAARRLGVNQSTMSRRVGELEGRVGPLFERLPEGLRPTPLAIRLLPHAERVESEAAELRRALHAPLAASGTVRVAVAEAVAVYLLLPGLSTLRSRHPDLRLELLADDALADLHRGDADLAIRHVRSARGDLVTRIAMRTRFAVIAAADLARSLGPDPKEWPWIGLSAQYAHLPESRWFDEHIGVEPVLSTNGYVLRHEAVRAGLGVAPLSRTVARLPGLVAVDPGLPPPAPAPIWLVAHRELRHQPRVAAVWDFLLELLGNHDPEVGE